MNNPATPVQNAEVQPRIAARVGQSTAIEQAGRVAEVEAAIVVAARHPRNVPAALISMRESCRRIELADRAFYRYPRGKDDRGRPLMVTGASIHLARELARVWGNIQYGAAEMRRDDDYGQSEMLAYAWDVQTNTRNQTIVINPHRRYTGGSDLSDLRDIYENNANVIARRVRECIFALLPPWFVEEAKTLCSATVSSQESELPLDERRANALEVFANLGVTTDQLEAKIGKPVTAWNEMDLGTVRVIRQSILRSESTITDEFPPPRVTADEIDEQQRSRAPGKRELAAQDKARREAGPTPAGSPATPDAPAAEATGSASRQRRREPARIGPGQVTRIERLLGECQVPAEQFPAVLARLTGRDITATGELSRDEFSGLVDEIKQCAQAGDGDACAAALVDLMRSRSAPAEPDPDESA